MINIKLNQKIKQQAIIFVFTFTIYVAVHSTRTSWSISKISFQQNMDYSDIQLGNLDFIFLISYSLSQKFGPSLIQRTTLKSYLLIGIIPSAISVLIISLLGFLQIQNFYFFFMIMSLNGVFQSTIWPSLISIMGNWFEEKNRGLLMGIWSGNSNVGNIFGFMFGQLTLQWLQLDWKYCILISGLFLLFTGIMTFFYLKTSPHEKEENERKQKQKDIEQNSIQIKEEKLNFFQIIKHPIVLSYAICYGCLKSSIYGMLFWLPSYLEENNMKEQAASICALNELGTFLGGVCTGFLSDRINYKRSFFIFPQLIFSSILILCVKMILGDNPYPYFYFIFAIGFFMGGPANILSAVIAIDLSERQDCKRSVQSLSAVIEGVGSLSAAFCMLIIASIGKENIFGFLFVLVSIAAIITFMVARKEKTVLKQIQFKQMEDDQTNIS